ncbi:MAG: hypothetical protein R3E79_06915 [Caldilineaceae bacterium]
MLLPQTQWKNSGFHHNHNINLQNHFRYVGTMDQNKFDQFDLQSLVLPAIRAVQTQIRWKPGKDISHLRTRICYGHLHSSSTIPDYEAIIHHVMNEPTAEVWVYIWHDGSVYPTIVSLYQEQVWLVMFGTNGIMETAFPPTDPDEYLADVRFKYMGRLQDITNE